MASRIEIDGKCYRLRRGKLVEIPPERVGQLTTKKTIRERHRAALLKRLGRRTSYNFMKDEPADE